MQTDLIDIGAYSDLKKRGISKKTCEKYNISVTKYTGSFGHKEKQWYLQDGWVYVFNYVDNGKIIKQKIRPADKKDYTIKGDTSYKGLFGQNIFKQDPNGVIVVTEGEFEAPVIFQETGFRAVSLPSGAGSLISSLTEHYDYLSGFKQIIIALDNDKPSNEIVDKFLESDLINKYGPGKIRIAKWGMKDANDLLLAGRSPDIKRALWDAEEFKPEDLFSPLDFLEEATKPPEMGLKTPFPALTQAIMGFAPNSINVIAAADGIGKTEMIDEIEAQFMADGHSVFIYTSEQTGGETSRRQAGKKMNLPLHIPGVIADEKEVGLHIKEIDSKLTIWKPRKLMKVPELIARMDYIAISKGTKVFIIDHLKGVQAQMADANREMDTLLAELKLFAEKHQAVIILVSHVAKNIKQGKQGKDDESWNRGRVPTKEAIYGSSAITAWASVILVLSRNVESDDPAIACVTKISILKKRLMGNRGLNAVYVKYIEDTGRLVEVEPIDYETPEEE